MPSGLTAKRARLTTAVAFEPIEWAEIDGLRIRPMFI